MDSKVGRVLSGAVLCVSCAIPALGQSTRDGRLHVIGALQVGTWDAETNGFRFATSTNAVLISACEAADGSLLLGGRDGVLRSLTVGPLVADAACAVIPDTDSDKASEATETGCRRQVMPRLKTEFAAEERPKFDGS